MSLLGEKGQIYMVSEGVARACVRAGRVVSPLFTRNVGFTGRKLLRDLLDIGRNLTE